MRAQTTGRPAATDPLQGAMAVYYIQGADGRIKIGKADEPRRRLQQLRTGSSVELTLLATEPGNRDVERYRHRQFASDRAHLEWFHPSPTLLNHIAAVQRGEQSFRRNWTLKRVFATAILMLLMAVC